MKLIQEMLEGPKGWWSVSQTGRLCLLPAPSRGARAAAGRVHAASEPGDPSGGTVTGRSSLTRASRLPHGCCRLQEQSTWKKLARQQEQWFEDRGMATGPPTLEVLPLPLSLLLVAGIPGGTDIMMGAAISPSAAEMRAQAGA
jgi:hypothetical protein